MNGIENGNTGKPKELGVLTRRKFILAALGAGALIAGCDSNPTEILPESELGKKIKEILDSFDIKTSIDYDVWASAINKAIKEEWIGDVFSKEQENQNKTEGFDFKENKELHKRVAIVLAIIKKESNFINPNEIKDFQTIPTNPQATTAGVMQVDVSRVTEEADLDIDLNSLKVLSTLEGGIKYGVKYLAKIADIYKDLEDEELKIQCIFADYNAGAFASRNTAIQRFLNKQTNANLEEDGYIRGQTINALQNFFTQKNLEINVEKDLEGRLGKKDLEETETWKKMEEINQMKLLPVLPKAQRKQGLLRRIIKGKIESTSKDYAKNVFSDYKDILKILEKVTK